MLHCSFAPELVTLGGLYFKESSEMAKIKITKVKKISPRSPAKAKKPVGSSKVKVVMHEFKAGKLHSGSKSGPVVTNPKQAIAISLSEARKSGAKIPKKRKK